MPPSLTVLRSSPRWLQGACLPLGLVLAAVGCGEDGQAVHPGGTAGAVTQGVATTAPGTTGQVTTGPVTSVSTQPAPTPVPGTMSTSGASTATTGPTGLPMTGGSPTTGPVPPGTTTGGPATTAGGGTEDPPTSTSTGSTTAAPVEPVPSPTGRTGGAGGPTGRGQANAPGGLTYYYNVPECAVASAPMPVVYAFHGSNQPPRHLVESLWGNVPDTHCFAVFALQSNDPAGWELDWVSSDLTNFENLVDHLDGLYDIDKSRRYLAGGSAGANLVLFYAPNHTEKYSGMFVYAGTLTWAQSAVKPAGFPPPRNARKIPVVISHGMNDNLIPYKEGLYSRDSFTRLGFPTWFFEMNGHCCDTRPYDPGYRFIYDNTPKGP